MKKLGLLLLISFHSWAQTQDPSVLFLRYFSNQNQRIEIKRDTLWVYWFEAADEKNPLEFRDTSAIDLRQIAEVKIIKGKNAAGQRGIGLQIDPFEARNEDRNALSQTIDAQKLNQTNVSSVAQKLQGQASGVVVGNDNSPGGGAMATGALVVVFDAAFFKGRERPGVGCHGEQTGDHTRRGKGGFHGHLLCNTRHPPCTAWPDRCARAQATRLAWLTTGFASACDNA